MGKAYHLPIDFALQRARCLGYFADLQVKIIETANLEARMAKLEQRVDQPGAVLYGALLGACEGFCVGGKGLTPFGKLKRL